MPNELTLYEAGMTLARAKKEDYIVTAPFTGAQTTLKRNTDFGVIPGTKQPSLFKAGAQKSVFFKYHTLRKGNRCGCFLFQICNNRFLSFENFK